MLGIRQVIHADNAQLTDILYYWLCGETDEVTRFMRTFETFSIEATNTAAEKRSSRASTGNSVYYENEGKRAAAGLYISIFSPWKNPGHSLSFLTKATIGSWRIIHFPAICRNGV